jgi:hypothetical protein
VAVANCQLQRLQLFMLDQTNAMLIACAIVAQVLDSYTLLSAKRWLCEQAMCERLQCTCAGSCSACSGGDMKAMATMVT